MTDVLRAFALILLGLTAFDIVFVALLWWCNRNR